MPYPIPSGKDFEIIFTDTTSTHQMPTMDTCDHYEIALIISGDRQLLTPNKIYHIYSNCILLLESHLLRKTTSLSNTPYKRILIKFSQKCAQYIRKHITNYTFEELFNTRILYYTEDCFSKIQVLFYEMLDEYNQFDQFSNEILKGMLLKLFSSLVRFTRVHPNMPPLKLSHTNNAILKSLIYLCDNWYNNPSLSQTAKYIGLTPTYFSRLFKTVTGTSYTQYILLIKLQNCRILLMQTTLSLEDISQRTGFCNANYLCNTFKKYYHETPTEFRQRASSISSDIINDTLNI